MFSLLSNELFQFSSTELIIVQKRICVCVCVCECACVCVRVSRGGTLDQIREKRFLIPVIHRESRKLLSPWLFVLLVRVNACLGTFMIVCACVRVCVCVCECVNTHARMDVLSHTLAC